MIPKCNSQVNLFFQACLLLSSVASFSQTITAFTPVSGRTGTAGSTTITISGTGFNTTPANNTVFFGAVYATPSLASATSLTVTVPSGATYQNLSVLNKQTGLFAYANSLPPFIPIFYNEGAMLISGTSNFSFPYVSSKPYFKAGDIDGDGKPDIVLLNVAGNSVSVLRNTSSTGLVNFATNVDFTTGTTPHGFSIVDIDGDGKQDIVAANIGSTTISILLNTSTIGSVSFATKVDISLGSRTSEDLTVADFDGDGKPDFGFISTNSTSVIVFRNTSSVGSASFVSATGSLLGTPSLKTIIAADFDGDGKIDMAALSFVSASIAYVYRNTSTSGTISFASPLSISSGTISAWFTAGDIDGDGKPDLITTNTTGQNVATLFNTSSSGAISFAARVGTPVGASPTCVVVGDIDGDGKPDLAVSVASTNTVYVLRNNSISGAISFGAKVAIPVSSSPSFLAFCDFDGDGKPDLAVVNSSTLTVQRNLSKDKFIFKLGF